ncbi:aldehyde ferredoxin oxidoreductase, partial [bacterium]|nr:aldehyde ferredoxin oxidoreductase [bacterium]
MLKLLRVNLDKQSYAYEALSSDYAKLGGRALTSQIINKEVPPTVDALDPQNKLIFAAGILAGTSFPNTGRLSIGAKSPLTGGIKEANSGGNAAQKLAKLGIQAVVLEGSANNLTTLKINTDGVSFIEAGPIKGRGNYKIIEDLKKEHGDKVSIISIGPAGENRLKAASVSVTSPDYHIRMAARGGLGAVMGSKNVKAIVIDNKGTKSVEIKKSKEFKAAVSKFTKGVLAYPMIEGLRALGTPLLVNLVNGLGCMPTRNFSVGQFDKAQQISGEHIAGLIAQRPNGVSGHRCMSGCIIGCSNIFTDEKGEVIVSGLEYESIVLTGSNCMIDDIDIIAQINRACNDIGVDTMDVGTAISLAMEAGILAMGDGNAALALVNEIREGSENGLMIGNGCKVTGDKLGSKRVPQVKGQSMAAYDPRGLKGTGTTYATSAMGADHTVGNAIPNPLSQYDPSS